MPASTSTPIFNNMRAPNFAALKAQSNDDTSLVPGKTDQKYLRRLEKEQKRKQPQLFIHGHPAMAPRCALRCERNVASADPAFGTHTEPSHRVKVLEAQVLAQRSFAYRLSDLSFICVVVLLLLPLDHVYYV
ncbi:hypothetical protein BJ742DRAFT_773139 [Cladochytrium replicatum]|nr:hypothetical protein BJ742DRAFT_773139 [Cladochytrium replicatum]